MINIKIFKMPRTLNNRAISRDSNIPIANNKMQEVHYPLMFPLSLQLLLKHRIQKPKAPV
jgi:hypothetical protein